MTAYQNALLVLIALTSPAGLYCAVRAALAWREFGQDADRIRAAEQRSVHREWHTAHGCMDSVAMLGADEATERVWTAHADAQRGMGEPVMDPIYTEAALPMAVVIFVGAVLFAVSLFMSIAGFAFFVGYLVWLGADFLLRCVAECTADLYDLIRGR